MDAAHLDRTQRKRPVDTFQRENSHAFSACPRRVSIGTNGKSSIKPAKMPNGYREYTERSMRPFAHALLSSVRLFDRGHGPSLELRPARSARTRTKPDKRYRANAGSGACEIEPAGEERPPARKSAASAFDGNFRNGLLLAEENIRFRKRQTHSSPHLFEALDRAVFPLRITTPQEFETARATCTTS